MGKGRSLGKGWAVGQASAWPPVGCAVFIRHSPLLALVSAPVNLGVCECALGSCVWVFLLDSTSLRRGPNLLLL